MVQMERGGRKKGHFFPQTILPKKSGRVKKKVVCMAKGAKMGRDWMAGGGEGGRAV